MNRIKLTVIQLVVSCQPLMMKDYVASVE